MTDFFLSFESAVPYFYNNEIKSNENEKKLLRTFVIEDQIAEEEGFLKRALIK